MKKINVKTIIYLIVLSFLLTGSVMATNQNVYKDSAKLEQETMECNEMVFNFWDKYTDYGTDTYLPPEYFGGFYLNENGILTAYITDDTADIKDNIITACGSNNIKFEVVKHSFNKLYESLLSISQKTENEKCFHGFALALEQNAIVAYVDSPEHLSTAINKLNTLDIEPKIEFEVYTQPAENNHFFNDESNESSLVSNISSVAFYPGQVTSFIDGSGAANSGTIGFCAKDNMGRNLLITHAHHFPFPDQYNPATVTVNGATMSVYTLSTAINPASAFQDNETDAAYIIIPSSISSSLTGKINNNSNYRITSTIYDSQLASYQTNPAACKAFLRTICSFINTNVQTVHNTRWSFHMTCYPNPGDSGGPVLMPGTTQNRLVGIIHDQNGNGILWNTIRDRYHEKTNLTLSVYTAA